MTRLPRLCFEDRQSRPFKQSHGRIAEMTGSDGRKATGMDAFRILTQFAFRRKMYYLCNSQAGLSTGKSRFFDVFRAFPHRFWPYCFLKFPVLQLKFQVFVLKIQYGLFGFRYFKPIF